MKALHDLRGLRDAEGDILIPGLSPKGSDNLRQRDFLCVRGDETGQIRASDFGYQVVIRFIDGVNLKTQIPAPIQIVKKD